MSTKYQGHSQETCEQIINQFKNGDLPKSLAPIFVNRSDNVPSGAWSWNNQLLRALAGTADARGFKQWKDAGRKVKKGARSFHILGPLVRQWTDTDADTGEQVKRRWVYGFKSIPVFRIESTEVFDAELWANCGGVDTAEENRLQGLPLRPVAEAWEIHITSYNGKNASCLGRYQYPVFGQGYKTIALGVENLSTWCHELVHAADHRNGTLTIAKGQNRDNEIVAELGGAVLLEMLGYSHDADLGGAWEYILSYSKNDKDKAIKHCFNLINRICDCVNLIIQTATDAQAIPEPERKAA